MCRLAFFVGDKDGRDEKVLVESLTNLSKSHGGDGMGVALFTPGKPARVEKGLLLTPEWCAQVIANRPEGVAAMWHARRCTTGERCDAGCHPFSMQHVLKSGKTHELVLAHNGSMSDWNKIAQILKFKNPVSDSHVLTRVLLTNFGIASDIISWGTIITAQRVTRGKWSSPWHFRCMRAGNGDLRGFKDGGVISSSSSFKDTLDRETPINKWITLKAGVTPPMLPEYKYIGPVSGAYTPGGYNYHKNGHAYKWDYKSQCYVDEDGITEDDWDMMEGTADDKDIDTEKGRQFKEAGKCKVPFRRTQISYSSVFYGPTGKGILVRAEVSRVDDRGETYYEVEFDFGKDRPDDKFAFYGPLKAVRAYYQKVIGATDGTRDKVIDDLRKEYDEGIAEQERKEEEEKKKLSGVVAEVNKDGDVVAKISGPVNIATCPHRSTYHQNCQTGKTWIDGKLQDGLIPYSLDKRAV